MYQKFDKLLQKNNISPYRVSKDTGISQATLSDWKRGVSVPKIDKLMKLAKYFKVPLEYFINDDTQGSTRRSDLKG